MEVLPSIDLRGGQVVRLAQGEYDRQTTYGDDPVATADAFAEAGARWIHVVDLDAARSGELTNTDAVAAVCRRLEGRARVQCGGGIRDREAIDRLRDAGVSRLVIGSAALKNPAWFDALLNGPDVPAEALVLGLDARDGRLAAQGWTEQLSDTALDWASRVSGSGLGGIVYTDIARDGMLEGVNVDATAKIVAATEVPVIASGGVAGLDDVTACRRIGCWGMIVGRAYYEGRVDIAEAVRIA
jgi:phosphoribosylformimino-5-aminoimidazole carboxamide ribotide isomerase